ncbi:beta-defensin 105-like isoform X2 [Tupaia chinensis]|uniref:beta-defensin 105-like isoform X2 n=1 Tax=Tupaia chinensis TaxID=246437 RepID=UPI000FFB7AC6|nr:beta-defensin 105-like isoform X2 [Tupaia chinensis]
MAPSRKMYFAFALFILAQLPSECQAGLEYSESFPGGEFAVCEPCRLGREALMNQISTLGLRNRTGCSRKIRSYMAYPSYTVLSIQS